MGHTSPFVVSKSCCEEVWGIVSNLVERLCPSVTNPDSFVVNEGEVGVSNNGAGKGGDIVASIAFAENVERVGLEFSVVVEEGVDEGFEVGSGDVSVVNIVCGGAKGETSSKGLVNEEKVCLHIPGVRLSGEVELLVLVSRDFDIVGPDFSVESQLGGAAWAAIEPDDDWIGWVDGILALSFHVEELVEELIHVFVCGVWCNSINSDPS